VTASISIIAGEDLLHFGAAETRHQRARNENGEHASTSHLRSGAMSATGI